MATNPFRPPEPISSEQVLDEPIIEGLTFAERIEKNRKARRRWSLACWAFGSMLIGLSMTSPPVAAYLSKIQQSLASTIVMRTGIVSFCIGILSIVLGPISWFWFHRRGAS